MLRVPVQSVPNQTLAVTVARQSAQIVLRQMEGALYFSLTSGGEAIVTTRICRDRQRILLGAGYRPFTGDFAFVDQQGVSDPSYETLGTRFILYYIGADE